MSYDSTETSVQDGAPLEIYDFAEDTSEWHFTSAELVGLTVDGVTYTSAAIERSELSASTEEARNTLTLTVPRTFPIAERYRVAGPVGVISVTLRRLHRGDADGSPQDWAVRWMGRVLSCVFEGPSAKLRCEPVSTSMRRTGLRQLYQRACPHVLYGAGCGLAKSAFAYASTVQVISGLTVTVGELDSAHSFAGGFVEWVNDDGNTERRFIESASVVAGSPETNVLTLTQAFLDLSVSDSVTVYPGCAHNTTACADEFDNILNYGGWPYIPNRNPFNGNPVF